MLLFLLRQSTTELGHRLIKEKPNKEPEYVCKILYKRPVSSTTGYGFLS
jgi:hypothetical protein